MAHGFGYRSDVRLRKENQDNLGVFEFDLFKLLIVCDGMGGHVGGRQASAIAVRTIHDELSRYTSGDLRAALARAIESANTAIHDMAHNNYQLMGMGTTVAAAVVHRQTCHVAWVGDSRVYLARDGSLQQISRDHTMVNLFVDAELLSPEDAATHPEAHVLSRSLGVERTVEVDLADPVTLTPDDRLLLCSDGVSGVLTTEGLEDIDWSDPQAALVEAFDAIAGAEGDDNATLVVFGPEVEGRSMPATPPPDLQALAREGRKESGKESVSASRRGTTPPQGADDLSEDVSVMDEAEPTVADDQSPARRRKSLPDLRNQRASQARSKGLLASLPVRNPVVALLGAGLLLLALGFLILGASQTGSLTGGGMIAPEGKRPSVARRDAGSDNGSTAGLSQADADLSPKFAPSPIEGSLPPVHDPTAYLKGAVACRDCSQSWAPVDAAVYLPSEGDPSFLPAFFDLDLPAPPRRAPVSGAQYDRRPPGGPAQVAAAQAVRSRRCREALDTVATAVERSVDYAALYNNAWFCFNDTHQAQLLRTRADTFEDLAALLVHLEGDRGVTLEQISVDTGLDEELSDTDLPQEPQWAWTWRVPATGGLEYRLGQYLHTETQGRDVPSLQEVIHDLQGDGRVADDLAVDLFAEVSIAAAIAKEPGRTPEMLDAWARRVYVATRALHGPAGDLIREWRSNDIGPMIQSLYEEATEGDLPEPVATALRTANERPSTAPPIATDRVATLASTKLSEDLVDDDQAEDNKRSSRGGEDRAARSRSRAAASSTQRASTRRRVTTRSNAGDNTLKVWYPHRSEPVLLNSRRRPEAETE